VAVPGESAEFDFTKATTPTKFYVVCSTPRSGSTLLTRALWRCGRMGAPHEYFNLQTVLFRMQMRFQCDSIYKYTDEVMRLRTGPNGVFAVKLHQEHWHTFWYCGRFILFKGLKYIRIRRRDRLAQAVSLTIARQTGQWTHDVPAKAEAKYDFHMLRRALYDLDIQERGWDAMFAERKVKPLDLVYEDFRNDLDGCVAEVCRFVGVDPDAPAEPLAIPELERQSTADNKAWAQRFQQDMVRWRKIQAKQAQRPSA